MNGLKIFALVLLSLSKFETMFGMKENKNEDEINDEYVNKNYYLIDHLGNKITLENDKDIKFKIYLKAEIDEIKSNSNEDILKISEEGSNKILTALAIDENKENNENKETYLAPIAYINEEVICWHEEKNDDNIYPAYFSVNKKNREEYKKNAIPCGIIKKIGEDSINDDYILVDAENNKIEKINGKNIVFKLLTRKKYLELKEKINGQDKFLKNDEGKYIRDDLQKPLLFKEEGKDLILYVKRIKDNLNLAWVPALETTIEFDKDNSIEVRMAKKKEIPMVKKEVDNDSSKCCCGIC